MPIIKKPNQHFDATTYTGNGGTLSVTNAGGFQPDLVWTKSRSSGGGGYNNIVFDSVRGTSKSLATDLTASEYTGTDLTSFNSNGFTAAAPNQWFGVNNNGDTYVAWQWKAGGASTVNTSGTISSNVSVNTTAGFSVVTYTGTGTAATVGHGLGVAPKMVIVKNRVQGTYGNWTVWHTTLTGSQYLALNATTATETNNSRWNGTVPTSTVFSVGTDSFGNTNKSGDTYVAYCWAEVEGYSKFGSYTGNGVNGNGPFVYCGFRPKFVMFKNTNTTQNWIIMDTARDTKNKMTQWLSANDSGAEYTDSNIDVDFLSNGFKIRTSIGTELNGSGNSIIFAAFAEAPFKYSNAR